MKEFDSKFGEVLKQKREEIDEVGVKKYLRFGISCFLHVSTVISALVSEIQGLLILSACTTGLRETLCLSITMKSETDLISM